MVGNDERSMIDGVSKIKDDLQPMEDDFDMMEDDLVMMEDDQNLLFPLNLLRVIFIDISSLL